MGEYDHILSKYDLFLCLQQEKTKNPAFPSSHFKNLESSEFTNKKYRKTTIHSLIANHVLKMSVKLKFQCVYMYVLKEALLCSGGFELVTYLFYQSLFTR